MSGRLNAILEMVSNLPDLESFGRTIERIRAAYDVDHVYYYALSFGLEVRVREGRGFTALPESGGVLGCRGGRLAVMSFPRDWIERYLEARFDKVDPVLHGVSASFVPVDWAELDWSGSCRQTFRDEARSFGVGEQGYTVPIRGPGGQFAIFTVNKVCDQGSWRKLLAEYATEFLLLGQFVHRRVLTLVRREEALPTRPLSGREREAIRLIASGMSRGRAAEALGISEHTIRVYIDSARHKLCALNVPHAIAMAAHRGLIPPP